MSDLYSNLLFDKGYQTFTAKDIAEALSILSRFEIKALILDQCLDNELGTDLMPRVLEVSPYTKVVFISSQENIKLATESMSLGACGFLPKSDSIDNNIKRFIELIGSNIIQDLNIDMGKIDIVGKSEKIKKILKKILKISDADTTLLLTGETGVGKELFAKTIHKISDRRSGPFIAINCAAISENLLEAELFGWKKGSFTDAKLDRKGYFETCSGGTLLLDEIGETSPSLQSKLLRVLQEKEVTPVGARFPIKIDIRVIGATNKSLKDEVFHKRFREDLYYRLAVLNFEIPPLRERVEDIDILLESFLKHFNKKFNKNVKLPNAEVKARLKTYKWPGNVRELYNAIERAVLLSENGIMTIEDLLPHKEIDEKPIVSSQFESNLPLNYEEAKDYFEKLYLNKLLEATNYNVSDAARISNQDRTNIYRIIKKHNLKKIN
jgi:DNA-binding NtrC family response regulator